MLLNCAVQQYAWGKPGNSSAVAQLAAGANPQLAIDQSQPYAELWMGTHPKGPSKVMESGQTLEEWITQHPESLGAKVQEKYPSAGQLPYLFKVLSVNQSLSIQAHPNKELAETLHKERPDKYPDPNHKPEMAVALTTFEGLCGFRPKSEILKFFETIPEFSNIVGKSLVHEFTSASDAAAEKAALQRCFTALMTCEKGKVETQLESLVKKTQQAEDNRDNTDASLGKLLLRLHSQFPGDVGCFVIYFLNHMQLEPGEAMFLEANLPHAYLSGDCMECMACSDNVVRAGLTPKYIDVPTLCSMLKYECKPPSANLFTPKPHPSDSCVTIYDPPVPDFSVCCVKVAANKQYQLESLDSGSIIILIEGDARVSSSNDATKQSDLKKGSVLFLPANQKLDIHANSSILLYRAYCQL